MVLRQWDRMYSCVDIRRRAPIAFTAAHFQRCARWLKMARECNYIHTSVLHIAAECYVWSTKNQGLTLHSYMQDSEVLWLRCDILHSSIHMYEYLLHYTLQKVDSSIQNCTEQQQNYRRMTVASHVCHPA